MHFTRFFVSFIFLGLTSCTSNYPNLGDVPDYHKPSLSLAQAQKELEELKAERQKAKDLALKVDGRA